MVPEAALGPVTPPKKMANATGMVATAASQAFLLTTVPMISAALPTRASSRCTMALSRLVPERGQDQRGEAAEGGERGHLQVADDLIGQRDSAGMTIVARSARIAAGTDHVTRQNDGADWPGEAWRSRARGRRAEGAATAESGITTAY